MKERYMRFLCKTLKQAHANYETVLKQENCTKEPNTTVMRYAYEVSISGFVYFNNVKLYDCSTRSLNREIKCIKDSMKNLLCQISFISSFALKLALNKCLKFRSGEVTL